MRSYITLYRAPFEHPNERNAMKNLLNTIYSIVILTLVLAADRPILRADRDQAEASPVQVTSPKSRPLPYRGTVGTVDTKKRTFTLINKTNDKSRLFRIDEKTRMEEGKESKGLKDLKPGAIVRGSCVKTGDKQYLARLVRWSKKTKKTGSPTK